MTLATTLTRQDNFAVQLSWSQRLSRNANHTALGCFYSQVFKKCLHCKLWVGIFNFILSFDIIACLAVHNLIMAIPKNVII